MLIKAIDEYLQTRPREKRQNRCFHPSSLHKPAKYLYHAYLKGDGDQEFPSRILRVFDNGHGVHERLKSYLSKIGILKQAEVPVENKEYEIKGHADGIVEINGTEGVLEIKSINANQFHALYEPKPEHSIQINVYMFCLGIPRGCMLYEDKNGQELKEFYVKQDSGVLDPILKKIRHVQECLKKGEEPTN